MATRAAIGIGFIGTSWMGRVHAHGLHTIGHLAPLDRPIRLVSIAGRDPARTGAVARELGFERHTTSWEEVVADPEVDVLACLGPNDLHAAPSIAAFELGKPVLCEKPLAGVQDDADAMLAAAEASGVTHACGFNYRFVPAVRLARDLVDQGVLGDVWRFSGSYLQDWADSPDAPYTWRYATSGTLDGAVGDYSHIVDLLRWLAGEPVSVHAHAATFIADRPDPADPSRRLPVHTEDAYHATLALEGGALARLEGSRCAIGWKGHHHIELNGSRGSLWWDMEDLNRLHVALADDRDGGLFGFRDVLVTEPDHPYLGPWWPPGHILGWEHTFAHQWRTFLEAVLAGAPAPPHQASFADGAAANRICSAILASARSGEPQALRAA